MPIRKYYATLAGVCLFATVTLGVATTAFVLRTASLIQTQLIEVTALKQKSFALTSEVYDRHGVKIGEFAGEQRYYVGIKDIPPAVIQAFLSAEDKTFYHHHGISPWSALRAVIANLRGVRVKQGASTITQQLARQFFLDQSKTWERKVKEALLAIAIERRLTKDEIFELYLNKIYFGNHSYGIEAASRNYFRKHVQQLTIAEAAVLAGLPKSPNAYAPHRHPQAASQRQLAVLMRMEEDGYLSSGEAQKWAKQALSVASGPEQYNAGDAGYVIQAVRAEISRKLEYKQLPQRGLRIFTTIDAGLQRAAAAHLSKSLRSARVNRKPGSSAIEGALVSLDPRTGAILAMQGGGDFSRSQFDRTAATKRPVGALILPFYIGLALERGYTLISRVGDDPLSGQRLAASTQAPTLYEVLRSGSTTAGAPLYAALGHGSVQAFTHRFGLDFARNDMTLAFGSGSASPLQVAAAYAAFSNGGRLVTAHVIERIVTANHQTIYQENDSRVSTTAVDQATAYILQDALRDAVLYGHAAQAKGVVANTAAIGAVTEDLHDAWFVASLPTILSVLWTGAERGQARLAGGEAATIDALASTWADYMRAAPRSYRQNPLGTPPPNGISYAKKPASIPQGSRTLPFLSGTEPKPEQPRRF